MRSRLPDNPGHDLRLGTGIGKLVRPADRLDVTVDEDIEAAVNFVENQGRGLCGVVNNAGVARYSPLRSGPESDIRFTFDVASALTAEGGEDFIIDGETRKNLRELAASNESMKDPLAVAQAVLHLMYSDAPKRRYMVTPDKDQAALTIRLSMQRILQLNEGQPYTFSRDELDTLLDELLESN